MIAHKPSSQSVGRIACGKLLRLVLGASLLILLTAPGAAAQPGAEIEALKKEIEALKENQKKMQNELDSLKKLVVRRRKAPPQVVSLHLTGAPAKGRADAKLTLVEFSDYQCPFCGRHARNTFPRLDKEYVQTGKLRYVFLDFPIPQLHPQSPKAHEAAYCAGRQGKYWQLHDVLFRNQSDFSVPQLKTLGKSLGLEMAAFGPCLDSGQEAAKVKEEFAEGRKVLVEGTPTFFLGYTVPDGQAFKSARRIVGAHPFSSFKAAIDALIANKKK